MTEEDNTTKAMLDELSKDAASIGEVGLVAKLMSANFHDYMGTTSALIDGYKDQIMDLRAELGAIRTRVNELFSSHYMPTETAIIQAVFYPPKSLIKSCREKYEDDGVS